MIDISDIKHAIKLVLHKSDNFWYIDKFEKSISKKSLDNYKSILLQAENNLSKSKELEKEELFLASDDPIVRQGYLLKEQVKNQFKNSLLVKKHIRILIHRPDEKSSPAGFSLFQNLLESLLFLGISADTLDFEENTASKLKSFKPSVFITGDNKSYLEKIDWVAMHEYRKNNRLVIGLTASLEEYGNSPLLPRLDWAKKNKIDFYYSFRDEKYFTARKEYKPFFDAGYEIISIPFGANPLVHYPVPNIKKELDYIFIASTNKTKAKRYYQYLKPIVEKYYGLIDGPGWRHAVNFKFNRERDRYLYSASKCALNIHLEEQAKYANETNERTYQLAACGIPQVTDHALILDKLFPANSLFVADSPKEYQKHFDFIVNNPNEAKARALLAQKTVFEKYTTFHRTHDFVTMLLKYFND